MKVFTSILVIVVIMVLSGCASEREMSRRMWSETIKENTIESYEKYLAEYPDGVYKKSAKERIEDLNEYRDYKEVEKNGSLEAYQGFVKKYIWSQYVKQAEQKIYQILDRNAFNKAKVVYTKEAFEDYLRVYSEGAFVALARQELLRIQALLDQDWAHAQKLNTTMSYERFLIKYPYTEYTPQAKHGLLKHGSRTELDRLRGMMKAIEKRKSILCKKSTVFIFAVRETIGDSYFVYKNEKGEFCKAMLQTAAKLYEHVLDLPLLELARPKEGVILYISYYDILDKEINEIYDRLKCRLFNFLGLDPEKTIARILSPRGVSYTRAFFAEYSKKLNALRLSYDFLKGITTTEEELVDLHSLDPDKQYRAAKVLGIFAEPQAIEPLKKALKYKSRGVRIAAKKASEQIEHNEFILAESNGTNKGYELYLKNFPKGKNASLARAGILENNEWPSVQQANSEASYTRFLRWFPKGQYATIARQNLDKLKWLVAKQTNTKEGYFVYLNDWLADKYEDEARKELSQFELTDSELKRISDGIKNDKAWTKKSDVLDELIFTGANLLNGRARWINWERGLMVYNILKHYDSVFLSKAMTKAVRMKENSLRVLLLVIKLGKPGTQKSLNDLLFEYGDRSICQAYLNSGSKQLYEGGKKWAKSNGYRISTVSGSPRVRWGGL